MLGTTHQLSALLAAFWALTLHPVSIGPRLGAMAIIAVMVGALTPDLDHPTANLWRRLLGGRAIGHIFDTFSGGHRHMTHSIIGIGIIGWALYWVATHVVHPMYVMPATTLWWAFMIGYISHPVADTFTDQGVPWLWPLKILVKIPPGSRAIRVTTGSLTERLMVRGGLIIAAVLLLQTHWSILFHLFQ